MSGSGEGERTDDEQWRAIVANFGDRAQIDDPAVEPVVEPRPQPEPDPVVTGAATYDDGERFVPPTPPPLPRPEPRRAVAWAGLFGAPVLVLIALVFSIDLPSLVDYLLIGWFVGGFCYLVVTMSRTPREPWDDGSRI